MIQLVQVLPITRLVGWAGLVGGSLSATLAALLFLGPMLGFYDFNRQGPGPRTSGVVELPAALVAAGATSVSGLGSALSVLVDRGEPVATILPRATPAAPAPAPAPAAPGIGGSVQRSRPGNDGSSGSSTTPAPTPQPATETPAPVAPVSPPVVSVPVAAPAAPVPAAAETSTDTRPGTGSDGFSADSSPEPVDARKNADKQERKAAKHAEPAALAAPVADEEAGDESQDDQVEEREQGYGQDDDQDQGRGNGYAKDNGSEKDKQH